MDYQVRQAIVGDREDVERIAAILRATALDDNASVERIARAVQTSSHYTHLAEAKMDGQGLGLLDAFMTRTVDGLVRWEIDLLGVIPEARGRGIAGTLLAKSVETGRACNANVVRGLVRVENIASQRAFEKAGFMPGKTQHLFVITDEEKFVPVSSLRAIPPTSAVISLHFVHTLTYSGMWIEGDDHEAGMRYGRDAVLNHQIEQAGILITATDEYAKSRATELEYRDVGTFRWWELPLSG